MATRSGRPMLNDEDPHYTTRTMHMATRCRDLHDKMEAWVVEHGTTMTSRQRAAHLIAESYWTQFLNERNWDLKQVRLKQAHDACLDFETLVNPPA